MRSNGLEQRRSDLLRPLDLSSENVFDEPSAAPIAAHERRRSLRKTRVFAHRGASGLFAEHTRAAYLRALEEGADGLEIDLHLTRDRELVCFHDPTLERTSDGAGAVADTTLAQMRQLDISSWKTPRLPSQYGARAQQLMTLQDVLELMGHAGRDTRLAIELKHPSPFGHKLEDTTLRVLLAAGWDPETSRLRFGEHTVRVTFMSFYPESLRHIGEIVPSDKLCALVSPVDSASVHAHVEHLRFSSAMRPLVVAVMRGTVRDSESLIWNRQVGIAGPGVSYVRSRRAEIKAWVARGCRVRVWTVDSIADADLMADLGVQEITTNFPGRMIQRVT